MTFGQYSAIALLGLVGVYVVVRLGSAAYFKSKQNFLNQQRGSNGLPR